MKIWSIVLGLLIILAAAAVGHFRKHPGQYVELKETLAEKMSDEKGELAVQMSIAIASDADPRGIYLSDLTSSASRLLIHVEDNVSDLQWSSDGRFLAFLTKKKSSDANGEIRIFDSVSSRDAAIASGAEFCWSSDAKKILYTFQPENAAAPVQFKIVDRETGISRVLLDLADQAALRAIKTSSHSTALSNPGSSASSQYASVLIRGGEALLYVLDIGKGLHTIIPANLGLWSPRLDELLVREPSKENAQGNLLAIVAPVLSPGPEAPSLALEEKSVVEPAVISALWSPGGRAIYYLKPASSTTGKADEKAAAYDLMRYDRNSGVKRSVRQGLSSPWKLLETSPDEKSVLLARPPETVAPDLETYFSLDVDTKTLDELRLHINGAGKIMRAAWKPRAGG